MCIYNIKQIYFIYFVVKRRVKYIDFILESILLCLTLRETLRKLSFLFWRTHKKGFHFRIFHKTSTECAQQNAFHFGQG